MPFKPSWLSDEAPRPGKAPASCRVLSEARGRFTLSLDQSTDGRGGSGSSAHRNQGAACLEDPAIVMREGKHRGDAACIELGCQMLDWRWVRG